MIHSLFNLQARADERDVGRMYRDTHHHHLLASLESVKAYRISSPHRRCRGRINNQHRG
jgi:hypothetical protein